MSACRERWRGLGPGNCCLRAMCGLALQGRGMWGVAILSGWGFRYSVQGGHRVLEQLLHRKPQSGQAAMPSNMPVLRMP